MTAAVLVLAVAAVACAWARRVRWSLWLSAAMLTVATAANVAAGDAANWMVAVQTGFLALGWFLVLAWMVVAADRTEGRR